MPINSGMDDNCGMGARSGAEAGSSATIGAGSRTWATGHGDPDGGRAAEAAPSGRSPQAKYARREYLSSFYSFVGIFVTTQIPDAVT
jgi:hypothetical protein